MKELKALIVDGFLLNFALAGTFNVWLEVMNFRNMNATVNLNKILTCESIYHLLPQWALFRMRSYQLLQENKEQQQKYKVKETIILCTGKLFSLIHH